MMKKCIVLATLLILGNSKLDAKFTTAADDIGLAYLEAFQIFLLEASAGTLKNSRITGYIGGSDDIRKELFTRIGVGALFVTRYNIGRYRGPQKNMNCKHATSTQLVINTGLQTSAVAATEGLILGIRLLIKRYAPSWYQAGEKFKENHSYITTCVMATVRRNIYTIFGSGIDSMTSINSQGDQTSSNGKSSLELFGRGLMQARLSLVVCSWNP